MNRSRPPDFDTFDQLVTERMPHWTGELEEFCGIRSEAADPDGLRAAAAWTADRLRQAGAELEVIEEDGVPPLVVGEIGEGPLVLNAVQHYDVQPAEPLGLWTSPPYEPAVRDGRFYARGSSDNKGQLLVRIQAAEAYRDAFRALPCRIRFLVEGEEESGSVNLGRLLDRRAGLRTADAALQEGGSVNEHGAPVLICGVRGLVYVELSVRTLRFDAHSGGAQLYPNAAWRLVDALSTLWSNRDGRVLIDGFYDEVRPVTDAQLAHLRDNVPFEEAELKDIYGTDRFTAGRTGLAAQAAQIFEPTCNVAGIWSGYTGPGSKTIVPADAHAKLDLRLVPDQDPWEVRRLLREHLDAHGFDDVEITDFGHEHPYWTPIDAPIVEAAARACEEAFGQPAVRQFSSPGTAPMREVCAADAVPMVALGCGDHHSRAHAPDESISLERYTQAARAIGRLLAYWSG
ncbi:MAG TPA: M20/M25/M40 family metallo-hydrolase [Candidatus Limnocylindria bacterium]|nr:M20/M25/M40 family metallo-hydrolase [Candidatus Limnocylindria bacterium]